MTNLVKAVAFAQHLQAKTVQAGNIAVDATAGKGYDTEFLARMVGDQGKVFAFDIQQQALAWTAERLLEGGLEKRVELINAGHEQMLEHVNKPVQAVMFNLGYLPGGSHAVITEPETTVRAVQSAIQLLTVGGLITIVVYPGHPGGQAEFELLKDYTMQLPQKNFIAVHYQIINQINNPPQLFAIEKIA